MNVIDLYTGKEHRYIKRDHREMPFVCDICHEGFGYDKQLTALKVKNHGKEEKKKHCDMCGK